MNWFNNNPKKAMGLVAIALIAMFMFELNKEKAVSQPVDTSAQATCQVFDTLVSTLQAEYPKDALSDIAVREYAKRIWDLSRSSNSQELKDAAQNFLLANTSKRDQLETSYATLKIICSQF